MLKEITDPKLPTQHGLINYVIAQLGLKNDAALCRHVKLAPPIISKVRHGRMPVTATVLLALHERTGLTVPALRAQIAGLADGTPARAQEA